MGDFNARVGAPHIISEEGQAYQYDGISDVTVNNHGRSIVNICNNNNMVIVNNLKCYNKHYKGNLTFKRRDIRLSEIDLCLAKGHCLSMIKDFKVHQNVGGSDHAPISITLTLNAANVVSSKELIQRAAALGQSQYNQPPPHNHRLKKSLRYKEVDEGVCDYVERGTSPNV